MVPVFRGFDHIYEEVRVWDLSTETNVETLVLKRPVTRVAFSSDGRSVAAGCDDGTDKVWINKLNKGSGEGEVSAPKP
jgi:WD40 repeat protein